jgi:hypothetical protein
MRVFASLLLLGSTALAHPALAATNEASNARRGTWFVAAELLYLETEADTGGQVTLTLNDNTTVGTDLSLLGANGIEAFDYAPRATLGWRWNHPCGGSAGVQTRFFKLEDRFAGRATLAPGTTPLANFATDSETENLELYTADLEAAFGYTRWGFTAEGTYGKRWAHFDADGEIEVFGVFTSGNFVNLQFSNGSAFEGDGPVMGLSLAYKIPRLPLSIFVGHRKSDLDGASNSFGRSVGSVASSPSPPLIGAATVRRSNETQTDLEIDETRFGLQADFGAPDARVHSFVRLAYEKMEWELDGPPTGGAGFGGTIGDLTTNGFASAGLGGVDLDGWSLAIGLVF